MPFGHRDGAQIHNPSAAAATLLLLLHLLEHLGVREEADDARGDGPIHLRGGRAERVLQRHVEPMREGVGQVAQALMATARACTAWGRGSRVWAPAGCLLGAGASGSALRPGRLWPIPNRNRPLKDSQAGLSALYTEQETERRAREMSKRESNYYKER